VNFQGLGGFCGGFDRWFRFGGRRSGKQNAFVVGSRNNRWRFTRYVFDSYWRNDFGLWGRI
jgi:hypothetical protein